MHNVDTLACYNLVYLVHNPRRDLVHLVEHNARRAHPRRDYNLVRKYSRDRNRRT